MKKALERDLADRQTYKERRSAALAEWKSLVPLNNAFLVKTASCEDRFAPD